MSIAELQSYLAPVSSLPPSGSWGFDAPWALALLTLVPAVLYLALRDIRAPDLPYASWDLAAESARRPRVSPRLPAALALAGACTALALAVAQPWTRAVLGADLSTVMLVVDMSSSMEATDVLPDRVTAASQAASRFVESVPSQMRVGLVTYSSEPTVAVPPTLDRSAVIDALSLMAPGGATATGDALSMALATGLSSTGRVPGSVSIVLLSDGAEKKSETPALVWADDARTWAAPVHTIAFGTEDGTVTLLDPDTQLPVVHEVPPDLDLMESLADATGGSMFTASNLAELNNVYAQVRSVVAPRDVRRDLAPAAALAALGLVVAAVALSVLRR